MGRCMEAGHPAASVIASQNIRSSAVIGRVFASRSIPMSRSKWALPKLWSRVTLRRGLKRKVTNPFHSPSLRRGVVVQDTKCVWVERSVMARVLLIDVPDCPVCETRLAGQKRACPEALRSGPKTSKRMVKRAEILKGRGILSVAGQ